MQGSKKTFRKIKKLENIFLSLLILIACKLFFITVVQHDYWLERARIPQRKKRVIQAPRGVIEDALGIPIATSVGSYLVGIQYSECKAIPRIKKKFTNKTYPRKEHIEKLASFLAENVGLEKQWVLDEIYAKALYDPHNVHVLKENIDEKLFYFLKMHESEFPGLVVEKEFKRTYPNPFIGCHLVGYLGRINRPEHQQIQSELGVLKTFIDQFNLGLDLSIPKPYKNLEQMQKKLQLLEQKVYRPDDFIGKNGIEKQYQHLLRGFHGIQLFEADPLGRKVCSFSSSTMPIQGQTIRLHMISPLQEFCQKILAHPVLQQKNYSYFIKQGKKEELIEPWIKPGSIIVLDPNDGSIYAMASYPFYSPQDFVDGNTAKIHQWLETKSYQTNLFMQQVALEKPIHLDGNLMLEKKFLTWKVFLDLLLPKDHQLRIALSKLLTLKKTSQFLKQIEKKAELCSLSLSAYCKQETFDAPFAHLDAYDRCLLIDLLRLNCNYSLFHDELIAQFGETSHHTYHEQVCEFFRFKKELLTSCQMIFEKNHFSDWRKKNEASFIKSLPKDNKKPFTFYLEKKKKELFNDFIEQHFYPLLEARLFEQQTDHLQPYIEQIKAIPIPMQLQRLVNQHPQKELIDYIRTFQHINTREEKLIGNYALIGNRKTLKDLALSFYPRFGFGFMRNHALSAQTPGSIFKLSVAMLALEHELDDFSITDISLNNKIAQLDSGKMLSRYHRGGRLPKSYSPYLGYMDFHEAIKLSSNPYFSLLAYELRLKGVDLIKSAQNLGFGKATMIDLPYEQVGFIPWDIHLNSSHLYAYAIGQHSLKITPLQLSNLFAHIATKGTMYQPSVAKILFGHKPTTSLTPLFHAVTYPHGDLLELAGVYFPLFCKLSKQSTRNTKRKIAERITSEKLDAKQYDTIVHAMQDVIQKPRGTAYVNRSSTPYYDAYQVMKKRMVGKTSTAQITATYSLDQKQAGKTYKINWFGTIIYEDETLQKPKLVILINAPFGPPSKTLATMSAAIAQEYEKLTN